MGGYVWTEKSLDLTSNAFQETFYKYCQDTTTGAGEGHEDETNMSPALIRLGKGTQVASMTINGDDDALG